MRSYRYIAALVLLLGVAGVGFGRAGIDSAGASSVRLTAGQIVYGHSLDSHHHVQNTATSFSTSDHFSWRAKFMHTAVAHNISRMTLTAAGKLISVRRPFSGNATYDYAWGDFSMSEFMANNGVSGSGTYVMRYVDKKGGTLAVGVFTIR